MKIDNGVWSWKRCLGSLSCGALVLAGWIFYADLAQARPRPPLLPFPEKALMTLRWDEPSWWQSKNQAPLAVENVGLVESWSGYAVSLAGDKPALLQYPIVDATGRTNLSVGTGSIRFWYSPNWSSASLGGRGPGKPAPLLELGAWTEKAIGWFSLYLNAEGTAILLSSQADGKSADYLKAEVNWQAGEWHQIALLYSPQATALYVDGALVSQGFGVVYWPNARIQQQLGFCIGGDATGQNLAQGTFDEFTTFDHWIGTVEIGVNYLLADSMARLGPITPEEDAEIVARLKARAEASALAPAIMQMDSLSCSDLKLVPTVLTNGNLQISICGADANETYNLFFTTNLNTVLITNVGWFMPWRVIATNGPGQTVFTLTNLPPNSFFILGTSLDSNTNGMTDAYEQLVNHSDPYVGLPEFKVLITQPQAFSTIP